MPTNHVSNDHHPLAGVKISEKRPRNNPRNQGEVNSPLGRSGIRLAALQRKSMTAVTCRRTEQSCHHSSTSRRRACGATIRSNASILTDECATYIAFCQCPLHGTYRCRHRNLHGHSMADGSGELGRDIAWAEDGYVDVVRCLRSRPYERPATQ